MIDRSGPLLVAHVIYRFDVGGLENGVVNLINRLPESSWRHAVLALTEVSPLFSQRVQRQDVQYVALHKAPGHLWRLYPRLWQIFRQLQPAVVHTRNLASLEAVVPAWAAGVPVRIHGEHGRDAGDPDGARGRYQWVRRAYSPFVSRYVAVSQDLKRYMHDRVGISADRVTQLYNGVDSDRFHPPAAGRVPIADCPFRGSDHWLVGTVGRMDHVKDQSTLARAFLMALRMNPSARDRMRLVIVGDGVLRAEVTRILDEGGAAELAWFAGERIDIPEIMRGLDCFVLPSRGEGISNTILEAMACGIPVVATRVGGNAELIEEGVTGQLVTAASPAALAQSIINYFEDPELAHRHGRAGRIRVDQNFSLDCMVDSYHELYLAEIRASRRGADSSLSNLPSAES
ncbi:MAG TPA: TIGR03088 family PEP-CTERM/XrtA system glycosyltransferase [Burkholderiaceae bacterium]|nr:TIGR03088 family PEP-CTERM/XrtA system glycosyltransferase [Burkholderiaceae bacterium]